MGSSSLRSFCRFVPGSRRRAQGGAALAVAVVFLGSACAPGQSSSVAGRPSPSRPTALLPSTEAPTSTTNAPTSLAPSTTAAPPPTTVVPVAPAVAPAITGVGTAFVDVVDASRPTVQAGRMLSSHRHLPTVVRYPTATPATAGAVEVPGAPAARGPWPLVVFAHGYNVTPETYHHLLHTWAAAGFVVAAPAFPLETQGGPLDENDLQNEPADISTVISAVLSQAQATTGPLSGVIDPARIAVTGHSDGAEAALPVGFSAHADARVGPIISMAAEGIIGGPHPDARHPLLVVQGTADTIVPPARSDSVYAAAGAPRYFLRLLGAGHLPPIADDNAWRPVVEQATIAFLQHSLSGTVTAAWVINEGSHPGLSTMIANP